MLGVELTAGNLLRNTLDIARVVEWLNRAFEGLILPRPGLAMDARMVQRTSREINTTV
jgi:hypothetical protein